MPIFTLTTSGLSINSYLIVDEDSRKAIAIDPTRDVQPILDLLAENRAELLYIVETHVHADFVSGAKELKAQLNGKPQIFCSAMGGEAWIPAYADGTFHDRESLAFGASKLEAWHTPGHTPEHMMYVLYSEGKPEAAFTGDFLFSGSVGRPDLLGTEQMQTLAKNLYHTIFSVLPELPGNLLVLPAHGAGSLCGKGLDNSGIQR